MKAITDAINSVGDSIRITIRPKAIRAAANKIDTLAADVGSRNLSLNFTYSQGEMVNQLKNYGDELKKTGDALALLFRQTAVVLNKTALQFETADRALASQFQKGQSS